VSKSTGIERITVELFSAETSVNAWGTGDGWLQDRHSSYLAAAASFFAPWASPSARRKMTPRSYSSKILMDAAAIIMRKTTRKKIAGEIPVIRPTRLSPF
jgi:hypothetical protein